VASNCLERVSISTSMLFLPHTDLTHLQCLICLDDYVPEADLRLLSCKHAFHKSCVDQWLQTGKNNCPACRTTVSSSQVSLSKNWLLTACLIRVYRRVPNQFRPLQSHHPRETARLYSEYHQYKNMHVRYPSCFWHHRPHCHCLTLIASCSIPIFDISCPSYPCQRNHPSTTSWVFHVLY
jgi:hypothetical protein